MSWQEKSMAILGYARTSTRDQEAGLQAQTRDLIAAGCTERDICTEQASSVRERPELDLLRRRILRSGADLVVPWPDPLARSEQDGSAMADPLPQKIGSGSAIAMPDILRRVREVLLYRGGLVSSSFTSNALLPFAEALIDGHATR